MINTECEITIKIQGFNVLHQVSIYNFMLVFLQDI